MVRVGAVVAVHPTAEIGHYGFNGKKQKGK